MINMLNMLTWLSLMNLLNLNHFWIMYKMHICKNKFHVCYHILDIYKNPGRKSLLTCPAPCILDQLIEIKIYTYIYIFLFSQFFDVHHKSFIFFAPLWDIYHFFAMIRSTCLFEISLTNQKWKLLRTNTYQVF